VPVVGPRLDVRYCSFCYAKLGKTHWWEGCLSEFVCMLKSKSIPESSLGSFWRFAGSRAPFGRRYLPAVHLYQTSNALTVDLGRMGKIRGRSCARRAEQRRDMHLFELLVYMRLGIWYGSNSPG
jgi:hypothetical protein